MAVEADEQERWAALRVVDEDGRDVEFRRAIAYNCRAAAARGLDYLPAMAGLIYAINAASGLTKIGRTRHPLKRLTTLQTGSPERLWLVACFSSPRVHRAEALLHQRYAKYRSHGEWFRLPLPEIEWLASLTCLTFGVGAEAWRPQFIRTADLDSGAWRAPLRGRQYAEGIHG